MKGVFEKSYLLFLNYLSVLPLLFFLMVTGQNKELDRLLSIMKTDADF